MAGVGPAPKRRSLTKDSGGRKVLQPTDVPADWQPPALPGGDRFCPETLDWYERISRLPQAALWGSGNWLLLHQTAHIACAFYCGDLKLAGELRLRQVQLELSDADLRRAGIDASPQSAVSPTRSTDAARRNRLLRLVNDDAASNPQEA